MHLNEKLKMFPSTGYTIGLTTESNFRTTFQKKSFTLWSNLNKNQYLNECLEQCHCEL